MIRIADLNDAPAIATIYNHYITNSIISFELEEITSNEMRERMNIIKKEYPFFVFEENGKLIGYAYASKWKTRAAYKQTVESSIYLSDQAKQRGIGTQLYKHLIEELKKRKIHAIIGGIALPNLESVRLHQKLGFKKVAHFEEVGYKFDKWIDVTYWQLINK